MGKKYFEETLQLLVRCIVTFVPCYAIIMLIVHICMQNQTLVSPLTIFSLASELQSQSSGAECKSCCGLKCRKKEYCVSSGNAVALMAGFTTMKLFH